ncbi:unnamed protein product [Schistocephalus solidus]|uniref:BZIP domain-containing protein n=1 Tax=Schistocephalus solidus TaxID=70667 RepID=A0A183SPB8_SCHSO|nr:unnamed protein product [Schistocephalus solidus]
MTVDPSTHTKLSSANTQLPKRRRLYCHVPELAEGGTNRLGRQLQGSSADPVIAAPLDPNKLKVERKRARNRLAARRCRERKVSLINSLENKVAEQNNYVKRLESELERYRNETNQLRLQLEQLAESFPNLREDLLKLPPPISTTVGSAVPQKLPHLTSFEKLEPPQ